jgi:hypothetical protein|tara:strand:+ start:1890 stop:2021 length:132 start_codon:yes stop_codon:yes gene_type:complete
MKLFDMDIGANASILVVTHGEDVDLVARQWATLHQEHRRPELS